MIKKIYNGSTTTLVDDALGNAAEALCSYSHLRGDDYANLSKHMEASEQRFNVMKEVGVSFVNVKMRDGHVEELVRRCQQHSGMCLKLKDWKGATAEGVEVKEVREALDEALRSRVHVKRSGPKCTQFRIEMSNGHVAGSK